MHGQKVLIDAILSGLLWPVVVGFQVHLISCVTVRILLGNSRPTFVVEG
jgi:hypothetical protein